MYLLIPSSLLRSDHFQHQRKNLQMNRIKPDVVAFALVLAVSTVQLPLPAHQEQDKMSVDESALVTRHLSGSFGSILCLLGSDFLHVRFEICHES